MIALRPLPIAGLLVILACSPRPAEPVAPAPEYLYLWTGSADSTQPDFLAVLDVTEDSARYGRLVTTLPVPGHGNRPHHTEHEMPADRQLFANGFGSGQSFVFDLTDPARPRLAGQFGDVEGFSHPHSFLRLPGGHVLATFQMRHEGGGMGPGGLVELTPAGRPVRSADAPGLDPATRVYSAGIVPGLDRIVTTTTDMAANTPARRPHSFAPSAPVASAVAVPSSAVSSRPATNTRVGSTKNSRWNSPNDATARVATAATAVSPSHANST